MRKLWRRSSQTQTLRVSKTLRVFWQIETVGDAYRFYLEGMPIELQRPSLAEGLAEG